MIRVERGAEVGYEKIFNWIQKMVSPIDGGGSVAGVGG